ncbi:MAG TPA: hypothetical protein VNV17_21295 [Solirubrobacteraceae bacterium]|nr:hypothetical protein [Solirubrobacteraceae bacterium]
MELPAGGVELLAGGVELLAGGVELLLGDTDAVDELAGDELLVAGDVALVVALTLGFGLGGGACSAGTAPAPVNGVMLACCELPALDGASDEPVTVGADVFLTADPMAKAATSPMTSAAANSSQRLRTS